MDKNKAKAFINHYPTWETFSAAVYSKEKAAKAVEALGELVGEDLKGIPTLIQQDKSPVAAAQYDHLQECYNQVREQPQ
ncbi:MAG TPA: hypothetical protein VF601_12905 [Beijerinckiaceae bacterium]|jgi:hypothetical protein